MSATDPTDDHYLTPMATAIDRILKLEGPGVVEVVTRMRADGKAWRTIALTLRDLTGIRVTYESVRCWGIEWGIETTRDGSGEAA